MFRAYHWTPETLRKLKTLDVFSHVRLIHEQDAEEKSWMLRIQSVAANGDKPAWESITSEIRRHGEFGRRRREALELVSGTDRVVMIGTLLKQKGDHWRKTPTAPVWLRWLRSQGVTEAEAIDASNRQTEQILSDPFWEM